IYVPPHQAIQPQASSKLLPIPNKSHLVRYLAFQIQDQLQEHLPSASIYQSSPPTISTSRRRFQNSSTTTTTMRRDSAALLSILPLLAPTYALPTYFGNEAVVARSNVERAPEPAAVLEDNAAEAPEHWLPKAKRQGDISGLAASAGAGGISIDTGSEAAEEAAPSGKQTYTIPNMSSQGRDNWLLSREAKAEAEAEADPAITLDMDYTPASVEISNPRLEAAGKARVRREAEPVIALDMDYTPPPVEISNPRLGAAGKARARREADPAIALDMDYTPPAMDIGSLKNELAAPGKARVRREVSF
ncbi:MAG: hypothetical protein Q9183_004791, partial [Haloplaca sp. 2 TL-2023]